MSWSGDFIGNIKVLIISFGCQKLTTINGTVPRLTIKISCMVQLRKFVTFYTKITFYIKRRVEKNV